MRSNVRRSSAKCLSANAGHLSWLQEGCVSGLPSSAVYQLVPVHGTHPYRQPWLGRHVNINRSVQPTCVSTLTVWSFEFTGSVQGGLAATQCLVLESDRHEVMLCTAHLPAMKTSLEVRPLWGNAGLPATSSAIRLCRWLMHNKRFRAQGQGEPPVAQRGDCDVGPSSAANANSSTPSTPPCGAVPTSGGLVRLYVAGLPIAIIEQQLKALFGQVGAGQQSGALVIPRSAAEHAHGGPHALTAAAAPRAGPGCKMLEQECWGPVQTPAAPRCWPWRLRWRGASPRCQITKITARRRRAGAPAMLHALLGKKQGRFIFSASLFVSLTHARAHTCSLGQCATCQSCGSAARGCRAAAPSSDSNPPARRTRRSSS